MHTAEQAKKLSSTNRWAAATAATVAACVLFAPGFATGRDRFFLGDGFCMNLPHRMFVAAELRAGRFPHWIPFDGLGVDLHANLAAGILHPFTVLYALLPFDVAFGWNYLLAWTSAALGLQALLRRRGVSAPVAFAASLAFAFGGPSGTQSNLHFLVAWSMLPWALLALEAVRAAPWRLVPLAGVPVALILAAGDPQTAVVCSLWACLDALGTAPDRRRALVRVAAAVACALPFAAAQLVPSAELFGHAARLSLGTSQERWNLLPSRLPELFVANPLVPGRFGSHDTPNYFGLLPETTEPPYLVSLYLGPLALAGVCGAFVRGRRAAGVAAAAWLLAALGPGWGVQDILGALVPTWKAYKFGEKLIFPASLALCLAGGQELDAWVRGEGRRRLAALFIITLATGLVAASLLAGNEELPAAFVVHTLQRTGLAVVPAGLLLAVHAFVRSPGLRAALCGLLVAAPVCLATAEVRPTGDGADSRRPAPASEVIPEHRRPPERFFSIRDPVRVRRGGRDALVQPDMHWTLGGALGAMHGYANLDTYLPGMSAAQDWIAAHPADRDRAARAFSVGWVLATETSAAPQGYATVREFPAAQMRVMKAGRVLPYAYVARSQRHEDDDVRALERISDRGFPLADAVLSSCAVQPGEDEVREHGRVRLEDWTPQEVALGAQMDEPGLVVLNERWRETWRAWVDGVPAPICRVDGFVRGVRLEAGTHRIVFRYDTRPFDAGLAISLLSLASAAVLASRKRRT